MGDIWEKEEKPTSDVFGDGVLDLETSVHLEEVEVAVGIDEEFDGSGGFVTHGVHERNGLLSHRLACRLVQERRWCLLDNLLVTTLDRALTLGEVQ